MKSVLFLLLLLQLLACSKPTATTPLALPARHETAVVVPLDTMIEVGGHQLHFAVWKGKEPAILFEAGGGDDMTTWKTVLAPIYRATGATLITYDRAGFGRSGLDSTRISLGQQVADLKTGLDKLQLSSRYLLVGHSFGGYLSTLFASRYPQQVKGAVLLDANHVAYYTDARVRAFQTQHATLKAQFRQAEPGKYWMLVDALQHSRELRAHPFPTTIPVVDILAQNPPVGSASEHADWNKAHREFVQEAANRKLLLATGSGHYVMRDSSALVVKTVVDLYQRIRTAEQVSGQ